MHYSAYKDGMEDNDCLERTPKMVAYLLLSLAVMSLLATPAEVANYARSSSFVDPKSRYRRVMINAKNATVSGIIKHLSRKMKYSVIGAMPSRRLRYTGTIKASLGQVASRLLG